MAFVPMATAAADDESGHESVAMAFVDQFLEYFDKTFVACCRAPEPMTQAPSLAAGLGGATAGGSAAPAGGAVATTTIDFEAVLADPKNHVSSSQEAARVPSVATEIAPLPADPREGIDLRPAGKVGGRFSRTRPEVFVTSRGTRLVYQLARGSKRPVLIVPGSLAGRHEACAQFGAEAATWREHTVLLFDRRNTGSSDVDYRDIGTNVDGAPVSEMSAQCADLAELIVELQLAPIIAVGYSSGARLCALLASSAEHAQLCHALAILIPTGGLHASDVFSTRYFEAPVQLAKAGGMRAVLSSEPFKSLAAANQRSAATLAALPVSRFIDAMAASAAHMRDTAGAPMLCLPHEALGRIGCPVAVIHHLEPGSEYYDQHTPDVARAVAQALPPGAGLTTSTHLPTWWGALSAFVAKHSGTA